MSKRIYKSLVTTRMKVFCMIVLNFIRVFNTKLGEIRLKKSNAEHNLTKLLIVTGKSINQTSMVNNLTKVVRVISAVRTIIMLQGGKGYKLNAVLEKHKINEVVNEVNLKDLVIVLIGC